MDIQKNTNTLPVELTLKWVGFHSLQWTLFKLSKLESKLYSDSYFEYLLIFESSYILADQHEVVQAEDAVFSTTVKYHNFPHLTS